MLARWMKSSAPIYAGARQGTAMLSELLREKVDARGRYQLAQGLVKGLVEVLVRTEVSLTHQQQLELLEAGCVIHSIVGNVLSARTDVARLEGIAQLPFVRKIELSRAMFEETER